LNSPASSSESHILYFRQFSNQIAIFFTTDNITNQLNPQYSVSFALPTSSFFANKTLYSIETTDVDAGTRQMGNRPEECNNVYYFDGKIKYKNINSPYTISEHEVNKYDNIPSKFKGSYGLTTCVRPFNVDVELKNSSYTNNSVSVLNNKSIFVKPQTSLLYKGERNTSTTTFANTKGIYTDFTPFFNLSDKSNEDYKLLNSKWKAVETSTLFDPYNGAEVESKDALDRYRSILYLKDQFVFNNQILNSNRSHYGVSHKPNLYIENAKQSEATVFNFESENELRLLESYTQTFSNTDKHYFEKVLSENDDNVYLTNQGSNVAKIGHTGDGAVMISPLANTKGNFYIAQTYPTSFDNDIIPFFPKIGKKYFISGWVKNDTKFYDTKSIEATCKVDILTKNRINKISAATFIPVGPIIDGWQRFSGNFTLENGIILGTNIYADAYVLSVTLNNTSSTNTIYFDDIRIHPADANVKNYIYDEQHRVKAMLDENNYATFYDYNIKGELVSVRRETEKGIVTIKENRKNNSNINAIGQ
jgi:NADH:ubiquinone oxidoreductase subunit